MRGTNTRYLYRKYIAFLFERVFFSFFLACARRVTVQRTDFCIDYLLVFPTRPPFFFSIRESVK